jgi:hypothetical protein
MRSQLCQDLINAIKGLNWTRFKGILDNTPNPRLYEALNEYVLTGTRLIDWLLYSAHNAALLAVLARLDSPQRAQLLTQPNSLEENILSWHTLMWPNRLAAILDLCDSRELVELFNSTTKMHLDCARDLASRHIHLLITQLLRLTPWQLQQVIWRDIDQGDSLLSFMLRTVENQYDNTKQQHDEFFELMSYIPNHRLTHALDEAQFHGQFNRVYHLVYGRNDFFHHHRRLQLVQAAYQRLEEQPELSFEKALSCVTLTEMDRNSIRQQRRRQENQLTQFAKNEAQRLFLSFSSKLPIDVLVLIAAHGFRTRLPCIITPPDRVKLLQKPFFSEIAKLQEKQTYKSAVTLNVAKSISGK